MISICIEQLVKSFGGKQVLNKISLSVSEGELFGLLGPSGAGKTTLIKILTGQLSYSGDAHILGKSCDRLDRSIYADIGIVTDNSGIYERLSCYDNLRCLPVFMVSKKILYRQYSRGSVLIIKGCRPASFPKVCGKG